MTQPPNQQHPYYQPQPQPPFNTYAIIAIILAVAVLPPLGIYFGHVAKRQIAETGERGIELAQASIVVGWILSIFILLIFLMTCGFFVVTLGLFGLTFGAVATST
jgi:magnesium-transporting ATPase (P-type)